MYGDTPPTVVAVDDALMRHKADTVARAVQREMLRRPTWVVGKNLDRLCRALERLGITLPQMDLDPEGLMPRHGAALVAGDVNDAIHVAAALGSTSLHLWMGPQAARAGPELPLVVKAHDDGIRLTVSAPEDVELQAS